MDTTEGTGRRYPLLCDVVRAPSPVTLFAHGGRAFEVRELREDEVQAIRRAQPDLDTWEPVAKGLTPAAALAEVENLNAEYDATVAAVARVVDGQVGYHRGRVASVEDIMAAMGTHEG